MFDYVFASDNGITPGGEEAKQKDLREIYLKIECSQLSSPKSKMHIVGELSTSSHFLTHTTSKKPSVRGHNVITTEKR